MNKISYYLINVTPIMLLVLGWTIQSLPAQAQIRGADSQEFFEEGKEQMQQDVEELEQEREKKEEELEDTLNVEDKDPNEPKVEDVASPDEELELDENLPMQPTDEEAEIKL